jgi:hypothetical protein
MEGSPAAPQRRRMLPAPLRAVADGGLLDCVGHFRGQVTLGFAQALGDLDETALHAPEDACCGKATARVTLPCSQPGENLDALGGGVDRIEVKLSSNHRFRDVVAKNQVRPVRARHEDTLRSGETPSLAQIEKALDLRANAADRLHLAELVDAAGDGDALVDAHVGQSAQHREELARARAVAVNFAIALLESKLRAQAERALLAEHPSEIPPQDGDPFGVNAPAQLRLTLDVDDSFSPDADDRGNAHWLAELDVASAVDRESVDDAHSPAIRIERDLPAQRDLTQVPLCASGAIASLDPCGLDVVGTHDA